MHLFHVAVVFILLLVVGIELSVPVFVNPSAWRLEPEPQYRMLSHFAAVLGKVMPVCYPAALVLLEVETWFIGIGRLWHPARDKCDLVSCFDSLPGATE